MKVTFEFEKNKLILIFRNNNNCGYKENNKYGYAKYIWTNSKSKREIFKFRSISISLSRPIKRKFVFVLSEDVSTNVLPRNLKSQINSFINVHQEFINSVISNIGNLSEDQVISILQENCKI